MPIYEYICRKCHHQFEKLLPSMREPTLPPCPQCQGPTKKAPSVFAAHSRSTNSPCGSDAQTCFAAQQGSCPGNSCPYAG